MLPVWRYYELHQPVSLPEDGVGQAERIVRKAEWLVARQAALIARLEKERDPGPSAALAREVLVTLQTSLYVAREQLRIARQARGI